MYRAYFVDDEPNVLEEFSRNPLFTESGFQTAGSATSPVTAIKEIKRLNPDVVFTDLKMPRLSGVEMMAELRDKGVGCEFVIISAYGEFHDSVTFFKMGGTDYLTKPVSDHDLGNCLSALAGKLAGKNTAREQGASDTSSPELNRIIGYLRETLAEKHTLESLSEALSIHPKAISRLFAGNLGTTFVAYLTKLRMERAASLLKTTGKDVQEISDLCGFPDYFYFCRVFREFFSCTPSELREAAK